MPDKINLQNTSKTETNILLWSKKMENSQQMLIAGILAVVLLLLVMQFITLIKITQLQNNQKRRPSGVNPAIDGKRHGNNPSKKHENRQNPNSNRPAQQNQVNPNKVQQQQPKEGGEKKFERISSSAQTLKETNTQLAQRPRPQQGSKPRVYSERTSTTVNANANVSAENTNVNANNNVQQKQERPANAPIRQQELPKSEEIVQEKPQVVATAVEKTTEIKAETIAEIKNEATSVQYGRR
jgi:hypothetical protein